MQEIFFEDEHWFDIFSQIIKFLNEEIKDKLELLHNLRKKTTSATKCLSYNYILTKNWHLGTGWRSHIWCLLRS